MNNFYTTERNAQIVIYLLKAHGIKNVIASPGSTNIAFVASVQHDPFFNVYSCVDERSAAYMACGLSIQLCEPVVLSCTGATAARNYMPGLTEAYYSNIPILAITSESSISGIGHLTPQLTDRSRQPKDIIKSSYLLPVVNGSDDWLCTINANKAILDLKRRGNGPVHINLITSWDGDFSVKEIPPVTIINRILPKDAFPTLPNGKIGIFVGSHKMWSKKLIKDIETFCEYTNAVVFCDITSNYTGKYKVLYALIGAQTQSNSSTILDLLIDIGGISGDTFTVNSLQAKEVWRVAEDGEIRDRFRKLTHVFEMDEHSFWTNYVEGKSSIALDTYNSYKIKREGILNKIVDIPFSNIWIASFLSDKFPSNSVLYLGIYNTLRAWNFFGTVNDIPTYSNVGGFGIDGMNSALVGASLADPNKIYFGISGDLGFFYDINVIGNRHIRPNVRFLLINNGKGQEFRNYDHPAAIFGDDADEFIAAAGHNGNKSIKLIKHFAEDLGYEYMSASNKDEFTNNYNRFTTSEQVDKPIIFEVFTNTQDEIDSLKLIRTIDKDAVIEFKRNIRKIGRKILR